MRVFGMIPSRMESSRLPGKPLADLNGLPMILHVAFRAKLASCFDKVVVCTDSDLIAEVCLEADVEVCLTKSSHQNGAERVGEAAAHLGVEDGDIVVDIQGDEPLVIPRLLAEIVERSKKLVRDSGADIIVPHLIGTITGNRNIVKVVESNGKVYYLTRADAPFGFNGESQLKKHLSIIPFTAIALKSFTTLPVGDLERVEGVELLRAIEGGLNVMTFAVHGESFSVDVPEDLEKARRALSFCAIAKAGYPVVKP